MPTESDLRELLGSTTAPHNLNAQAIIRRSKARRLPRQIGAGGVLTLAVAGIGVSGIQLAMPPGLTATMSDESSAQSPEIITDQSLKRAPADKLNLCSGTLAEVAPSQTGLVLTPNFPAEALASSGTVSGVVTLTNTGSVAVSGITAASPAITLSQNGIVLWHSNGPMIMLAVVVDLVPSESMDYTATFTAVRCEVEDDSAQGFRADLPALSAGDYQLSAAMDFTPDVPANDSQMLGLDLVVGPLSTITLR